MSINPNLRSGSSPPVSSHERLLTPDEVADVLSLSRELVIKQARSGKIPSLKLGKAVRFRLESIIRWLLEQETRGRVAMTAQVTVTAPAVRQAAERGRHYADVYIVKSKSRYLCLKDGGPFTNCLTAEIVMSTRRNDATEFSSLKEAQDAKTAVCSTYYMRRAYWSDQIFIEQTRGVQ